MKIAAVMASCLAVVTASMSWPDPVVTPPVEEGLGGIVREIDTSDHGRIVREWTEERHGGVEPEVVEGRERQPPWASELEHDDMAAGTGDAGHLGDPAGMVGEVPQAEADGDEQHHPRTVVRSIEQHVTVG